MCVVRVSGRGGVARFLSPFDAVSGVSYGDVYSWGAVGLQGPGPGVVAEHVAALAQCVDHLLGVYGCGRGDDGSIWPGAYFAVWLAGPVGRPRA
jgi:hypothetical protein